MSTPNVREMILARRARFLTAALASAGLAASSAASCSPAATPVPASDPGGSREPAPPATETEDAQVSAPVALDASSDEGDQPSKVDRPDASPGPTICLSY